MQAIIGKKKRIFFFIFLFIFLSTIQIPINKKYSDKSLFFPINFIEITGTSKIDKVNLLNDFNDFLGLNLFFLNKKKFEEILLKNKLIKNFTVSKEYPNTIQIKIDEINFLGILIRHNNKYFISDNDLVILYNQDLYEENLPRVYGKDSEKYFSDFKKFLIENNFDIENIKEYYYFRTNRWDLVLNDNKKIKLSTNKLHDNIKLLNRILLDEEFKKYSIIDLRIENKIITE